MFRFTGLKPGTYKVQERMVAGPDGLIQDTGPDYGGVGTPDGVEDVASFDVNGDVVTANQGLVLDDTMVTLTVLSGGDNNNDNLIYNVSDPEDLDPDDDEEPEGIEWGNYVFGSIHGFKFQDYDRDGVWDKGNESTHELGEPPLEDVMFHLWKFVDVDQGCWQRQHAHQFHLDRSRLATLG